MIPLQLLTRILLGHDLACHVLQDVFHMLNGPGLESCCFVEHPTASHNDVLNRALRMARAVGISMGTYTICSPNDSSMHK